MPDNVNLNKVLMIIIPSDLNPASHNFSPPSVQHLSTRFSFWVLPSCNRFHHLQTCMIFLYLHQHNFVYHVMTNIILPTRLYRFLIHPTIFSSVYFRLHLSPDLSPPSWHHVHYMTSTTTFYETSVQSQYKIPNTLVYTSHGTHTLYIHLTSCVNTCFMLVYHLAPLCRVSLVHISDSVTCSEHAISTCDTPLYMENNAFQAVQPPSHAWDTHFYPFAFVYYYNQTRLHPQHTVYIPKTPSQHTLHTK